jgi:hypothetical protein
MPSTLSVLALLLTISSFSNAYTVDWSKESVPFAIKHFYSNKFIHPRGGSANPAPYITTAVIHHHLRHVCFFTFVPILENPGFGFIRH